MQQHWWKPDEWTNFTENKLKQQTQGYEMVMFKWVEGAQEKFVPLHINPEYHYSGFNFSHYDLPFPTRYCIPYVRSGLYQLVIRVKGFRVSAHDLNTHCMIRFCPSAWTPRFQKVELCIASARTTLAVSAVAPS